MAKGLRGMAPSGLSPPFTTIPGYPTVGEVQEDEFKYNLMKTMEGFKQVMSKLLEEVKENATKQVETFKEETNK